MVHAPRLAGPLTARLAVCAALLTVGVAVLIWRSVSTGAKTAAVVLAEGRACLAKGIALYAEGDPQAALAELEQACGSLPRADALEDLAKAWSHRALCLQQLNRGPEELAAHRTSLELHRELARGGASELVARCLFNLAACAHSQSNLKDALAWQRAGNQMVAEMQIPQLAMIVRGLVLEAVCLVELQRAADALPLLEQAEAMLDRDPAHASDAAAQARAECLWAMARCHRQLGRLADAIEKAEAALALLERTHGRTSPSVARLLGNLVTYHLLLGRPEAALPRAEAALSLLHKSGADQVQLARACNLVASCQHDIGRYADAATRYQKAIDLLPTEHAERARYLGNLAACRLALGDHAGARSLADRELALVRASRPDHPDHVVALTHVAACLEAEGKTPAALERMQEALGIAEHVYPTIHPDLAWIHGRVAQSLEAMGSVPDAVGHYGKAIEIGTRTASASTSQWQARLGGLMARAPETCDRGIELLARSIERIEDQRSDAAGLDERDQTQFFQRLKSSRPYESMVTALMRAGRPAEAFDYIERARGRALLDLLERSRVDVLAQAEKHAQGRGEQARVDELRQVRAEVARWEDELDRLRSEPGNDGGRDFGASRAAELERASSAWRSASKRRTELIRDQVGSARPADLQALAGRLATTERILSFYFTEDEGYVFLAGPGPRDLMSARIAVTAAGLEVRTRGYVARLSGRDEEPAVRGKASSDDLGSGSRPGSRPAAPQIGWELFSTLIPEQLWRELKRAQVVHVVPHRALHRIPLEALVVSEPLPGVRNYWIDAGPALTYASSIGQILWSRGRPRRAPGESGADLVALGDPVLEAVARSKGSPGGSGILGWVRRQEAEARIALRSGLPPIPETREEVGEIVQLFRKSGGKVAQFLGPEATEAKLFEAARSARYLHLATHGLLYSSGSGVESTLVLSYPKHPTPLDDGFLGLSDLLERWRGRLTGCELVVLSCCETQKGLLQPDEGFRSLPWGFMTAGARSVIASLWQVKDDPTRQLMGAFHAELRKSGGRGKLEAFVKARKALKEQFSSPMFWAPFVFVGDPE